MPKLKKAQLQELEHAIAHPIALNVCVSHSTVEVIAINVWECDEIVVKVDNGEPKLYKLQFERTSAPDDEDETGRTFWSDGRRRYYLDECVRYDTPWLSRPEPKAAVL